MPERWKLRLIRHFWRPNYFEELLKRLEKNTNIDAVTFDADKKRFYEMKKKRPRQSGCWKVDIGNIKKI